MYQYEHPFSNPSYAPDFWQYINIYCITLNSRLLPHLGFDCAVPSFANGGLFFILS